jgi:hypothetical protein
MIASSLGIGVLKDVREGAQRVSTTAILIAIKKHIDVVDNRVQKHLHPPVVEVQLLTEPVAKVLQYLELATNLSSVIPDKITDQTFYFCASLPKRAGTASDGDYFHNAFADLVCHCAPDGARTADARAPPSIPAATRP